MSQKSNKAVKADTTGNIGKKYELPRQNYRNIFPLTNKNLNVFNIRNETTSESYNSSNSSLDNDPHDDDAETVITDYASNPYGLTTPPPPPPPNDEMDVYDYEAPATELKTYEGNDMYYIINGEPIPVTSASYNRDMSVYDFNGKIIPKKEHLPENRLFINNDIIMDESSGGKKKRKTLRKTKRKTKRKTRKTRRNKRRHTRKYK